MLDRASAILKLALALAVLLAGGGVGYYYGIFLPNHARVQEERHQANADAAEKARRTAEAKVASEQARRQQTAQMEYEDCLNFAELSYKNRWAASCRAMNRSDAAEFEDCLDNLFSTEESCRRRYPIRPERGCALPSQIASSLSADRDRARGQCLGRLQASRMGG
ncbi:MAG TPA: hypothetical protein VJQ77_07635 [Novosphingobium sp.]|nr:hypothetical protein [Novosphingobium sp.]